MVRSLRDRLGFFKCHPEIIKCALTLEDIWRHNLPPEFTKKTDTRATAFVAKHGDIAVELDALPLDELQRRLKEEVASRMDLTALAAVQERESIERARLAELFEGEVACWDEGTTNLRESREAEE
jgi:hypothetical protein